MAGGKKRKTATNKGKSPVKAKQKKETNGGRSNHVNKQGFESKNAEILENSNDNLSFIQRETKQKKKGTMITTAKVPDEEEIILMEVGQDSEFVSEDSSDEESYIVSFKEQAQKIGLGKEKECETVVTPVFETDEEEEEEDGEL